MDDLARRRQRCIQSQETLHGAFGRLPLHAFRLACCTRNDMVRTWVSSINPYPTPMRLLSACVIGGIAAAVSLFAQNDAAPYAVWTLAGRSGQIGAADGTGANARFNRPWGIAVDSQGNVYVTEAVNHIVRKITPDGVVSTLAGTAGEVGTTDGMSSAARFASIGTTISSSASGPIGPFGIAVDLEGTSYVADANSQIIRRITPAGLVSTFSGQPRIAGSLNGDALQALYRIPVAIAMDASGNIFIADTYNHVIRRISPLRIVTTIAGSVGVPGSTDGIGSAARFLHPTAIAVSPLGEVYVADSNNIVRRLTATAAQESWSVTTIAGSALTFGTADGTGSEARFGAAPTPSQSGGQTVTFPSFIPVESPSAFIGTSYRLGDLPGLAVDRAGNVFVSDFSNNTIRKISPAGVVTTIGGTIASGATDGLGTSARFRNPCGIAVDAAGTLYIADYLNHMIRKGALAAPPVIQSQPGSQAVAAGANVALTVNATGSPPPAIQWWRNGAVIIGATDATLALSNVQAQQAGTYSATVMNAIGSTFTIPLVLTVMGAPVITAHPVGRAAVGGQTITLTSTAVGFPVPTYQWLRDGAPIPGQTNASLLVANAQDEDAGEYRVVVSNTFGTTTSNAAVLRVTTGRIINLSIRTALVGSEPLIAGFVVSGGTKPFLIRAAGPALRQFGVGNPVADPQLTIQVGTSAPLTNDNWSSGTDAGGPIAASAVQVGAFPLPAGSLDSAALASVTNSTVTAQASARNNTGGVVLLELFEMGGASLARLVNVSTRAQVGVGENALFAGFVLGGNSQRTVLVRAIGPTLGAFGVASPLADPLLEVFATGATTPLTSNDNWNGDAGLISVFARVGAFPLPATSSRDAALVISLAPGGYSARVAGVGNTTGEVLLEIYEVP
jgi:hypothetical protein